MCAPQAASAGGLTVLATRPCASARSPVPRALPAPPHCALPPRMPAHPLRGACAPRRCARPAERCTAAAQRADHISAFAALEAAEPASLSNTSSLLRTLEDAAAAALQAGDADDAYLNAAMAELRARLAGWPPLAAPAAAAPPATPTEHAPPTWTAAVSRSWVAGGGTAGVRALWRLPCGGWLLVRARSVAAPGGGAMYAVEAITDVAADGRVQLQWGVSPTWGVGARADVGDARDSGVWPLLPPGEGVVGGSATADVALHGSAQPVLRRCSARLRCAPGAAGLCFLLQTPRGVVHNAGREYMLPLPCGLLSQLAADAAAAGDCAARITLSLGRGVSGAGSVLAIVRNADADAGGVVVELFSDAPHPLVLHWGVLSPGVAEGRSAWHAPPPEMRPAGATVSPNGAVQTPFAPFTAAVAPGAAADGQLPAAATLQRACLAFHGDAAESWLGLAFVLRSADGALAWRDNWRHFEVPWAAEACAAVWGER